MGFICGILGKADPAVTRSMAQAMRHRGTAHLIEGDAYTVASSSPGGSVLCFVDGTVRAADAKPLTREELFDQCRKADDVSNLGFRGMFAAAVCAGESNRWRLMRDRLGAKPLYYFQCADALLFASELKGLLASGRIPRRLNLVSVDRYLTLRCVPGPESIIQEVHRVRPGHALEYRDGTATEVRFADFDWTVRRTSRENAAKKTRDLLEQAADTDADALLWSGGIDCAALAALGGKLPAKFIALERSWQQTSRHVVESARKLGIELERLPGRRLTEANFENVVFHLDEPIADAAVFPLWLIIQQAATQASTLVSGHGADELLGGYPRFHFLQKAQDGARGVVPVTLLGDILPALPPNAFVRRGSRYLAEIHDKLEAYLSLLSVFDHDEREALYTDAMKAVVHDAPMSSAVMRPHFARDEFTASLLSLDLSIGLPDLLLLECDRIAAAHGVTLTLPYLDDRLVDFAVSLPPAVKFGVRSKPVLRMAMKGLLPGRMRLRGRRGFKVPQEGRVMRVIERVAQQSITQERVEATGLFKWQHVQQVLRSASHNVYRRRQFWALLMFFTWYRGVMES